MLIINFILVIMFWFMIQEAVDDDRYGWAYTYLFLSALNGAAVMTTFF